MRRKRLKHIADNLCHMFCGWQTFFDYNELVKLGNGRLKIDALSGQCIFNETSIEPLSIAKALQNWLKKDCEDNKIDMNQLLKGQIIVDLDFTVISWKDRKYSNGEQFLDDGRQIKTKEMHRCHFYCESYVKTDEKIYQSNYSRIREWPFGWPKTS